MTEVVSIVLLDSYEFCAPKYFLTVCRCQPWVSLFAILPHVFLPSLKLMDSTAIFCIPTVFQVLYSGLFIGFFAYLTQTFIPSTSLLCLYVLVNYMCVGLTVHQITTYREVFFAYFCATFIRPPWVMCGLIRFLSCCSHLSIACLRHPQYSCLFEVFLLSSGRA